MFPCAFSFTDICVATLCRYLACCGLPNRLATETMGGGLLCLPHEERNFLSPKGSIKSKDQSRVEKLKSGIENKIELCCKANEKSRITNNLCVSTTDFVYF